jgi:hypothetical protein
MAIALGRRPFFLAPHLGLQLRQIGIGRIDRSAGLDDPTGSQDREP